jgi:hypothetical protein
LRRYLARPLAFDARRGRRADESDPKLMTGMIQAGVLKSTPGVLREQTN